VTLSFPCRTKAHQICRGSMLPETGGFDASDMVPCECQCHDDGPGDSVREPRRDPPNEGNLSEAIA
jgi:hypothetical protein